MYRQSESLGDRGSYQDPISVQNIANYLRTCANLLSDSIVGGSLASGDSGDNGKYFLS